MIETKCVQYYGMYVRNGNVWEQIERRLRLLIQEERIHNCTIRKLLIISLLNIIVLSCI